MNDTRAYPELKLTTVFSSSINAIGYDAARETLFVEFVGGNTYSYADVSAAEHQALIGAPSIGAHFAKHIRKNYAGEKQ